MQSRSLLFSTAILFVFSTVYPAASQNPQERDQNSQSRPAPGGDHSRPGNANGNRPQPSRPNPGGAQVQPGHSNPDNGNRPQPDRRNPGGQQVQPRRPNPGNGNNQTQPGRPDAGPQVQPDRPNPGNGNSRPQPGRPNDVGGNNRPQAGHPNYGPQQPQARGGRPAHWGQRPQNRPSYNFRNNDRSYLHRYYSRNLSGINRASRPRFAIGGFFPYAYIPYLSPLPPDVYGYLPPPPPGYAMGYYDGYVVVYDPISYFILNVIDLMQ